MPKLTVRAAIDGKEIALCTMDADADRTVTFNLDSAKLAAALAPIIQREMRKALPAVLESV